MGAGVATAEQSAETRTFSSAAEMRDVLTHLLSEIEGDSNLGRRLGAAHVSYRYVFTDFDLALNISSSDEPGRSIRWSFADQAEWDPALTFEMSSEVANRYLQGRENLAIAMARGTIRTSGEASAALSLLPISSQLNACYREVLERHHPHLLLR